MTAMFTQARRSRRGMVLVYVTLIMSALMGICSLAVDLGRYEVAHNQMYNAAMALAKAGAAQLPNGSTAVVNAIHSLAADCTVDGHTLQTSAITIQYIKWVSAANFTIESTANISQANAVRVILSYNVPLAFAEVLGLANKQAVEMSTAELSIQTATPYVYATGDPWLAGEPAGTQGSQADPNYAGLNVNTDHRYPYDIAGTPGTSVGGASSYGSGQPYASPIQVAITVTPGATITITNVTGTVSHDYDTPVGINATGNNGGAGISDNAKANGIAEHGIADVTMPLGAMNAVFLGTGLPDNIATVPSPLDFSTQAKRDYLGLKPDLQQPFFVGTGQTSGGQQQQIVVPPNATRLFMGIMDGWEWNNNLGGFNCTITQTQIITVQ